MARATSTRAAQPLRCVVVRCPLNPCACPRAGIHHERADPEGSSQAAKLDGKQPGANKKKVAKKSGADEPGAARARGKAGGKPAGPKPASSRKGGAAGSKKLPQMPGTQAEQHTMRAAAGSQSDAGKGKLQCSARAAALVGMANASASHSGNGVQGRREAPKGIRAMFQNIGTP